jgi:hypothetical protein
MGHYGPPFWTPVMDPRYGPPFWTPILYTHLGPPLGPYLGPLYRPLFGPLFWTPILDQPASFFKISLYKGLSNHNFCSMTPQS